MIAIKKLVIRNFLSYGNYDTIVDFSQFSQCYIAGQNGAGKSSLLQAILWCLSGSTMHTKTPGSRIRNYWSEDDTLVRLEFVDGSELTRIRTSADITELLYRKNGEDIVSGTVSTTSNQQQNINRILKFDYDVFCGSVFLSQFRQGWLKMSDQHRKQIFERIMGIDRVNVYATIAKQEFDKIELKVQAATTSVDNQRRLVEQVDAEIVQTARQQQEFIARQRVKSAEKSAQADKLVAELSRIDIQDMPALRAKWDIIAKVADKITKMRENLASIDDDIERDAVQRAGQREASESHLRKLRSELAAVVGSLPNTLETKRKEYQISADSVRQEQSQELTNLTTEKISISNEISGITATLATNVIKLKQWEDMDGTTCSKCEQQIPHEHATKQAAEYRQESQNLTGRRSSLLEKLSSIEVAINDTKQLYTNKLNVIQEEARVELDNISKANNAVAAKIQADIDKVEILDISCDQVLLDKRTALATRIKEAESKLNASKPPLTVEMAEVLRSKYDLVQQQISGLRKEAEDCLMEQDPHLQTMERLQNRKDKISKEIGILESQLSAAELVTEHTKYVYKAYSDRRRIKSQLIAESRPYLNDRIHHYLSSLGLDIRIKMSDALGLDSDLWGHEFQSGGERARAELSLAFASFDLYNNIHGPQSNFMVLDEPDDGLDEQGIDRLINIIHSDLVPRFDNIFIISHRDAFRDVFPNTMTIAQDNRLSRIVEVS